MWSGLLIGSQSNVLSSNHEEYWVAATWKEVRRIIACCIKGLGFYPVNKCIFEQRLIPMNLPGSILSWKALWPMLGDRQQEQLKYTWKGRKRSSIALKKDLAKPQYESQAPQQSKWGPRLDCNSEGERRERTPAEAPPVKTYVGGSLLLHLGTRALTESLSIPEAESYSTKKPRKCLLSCHTVIPL